MIRRHLEGVGIADAPIGVGGLDGCACIGTFRSADSSFDPEQMRRDMVEAAKKLAVSDPAIGAIVVECTNMPPYSAAAQAAVGLPVFDLVTLINYMQTALAQEEYQGYL